MGICAEPPSTPASEARGPALVKNCPEVQKHILDRKYRSEPRDFKQYLYLTDTPGGKQVGMCWCYNQAMGSGS